MLLQALKVRAGDLKTIIVRSSQGEEVTVSLFVKTESFPALDLPEGIQGLRVYYSNPKSPASVLTKLLYERGASILRDDLLEKTFLYDTDDLVDMYAGVGSIGLSVAGHKVDLIDLDPATVRMARINAASSGLEAKVIESSSEKALEFINGSKPLIVDPPRAGLHGKVTARILEVMPPQVIYLSCNPATQARDLLKLQEKYTIGYFEIFNFFPRTPHIETLAILQERRS
jgi:23S rRNA (uracil1939-C5)-methyltransferase